MRTSDLSFCFIHSELSNVFFIKPNRSKSLLNIQMNLRYINESDEIRSLVEVTYILFHNTYVAYLQLNEFSKTWR